MKNILFICIENSNRSQMAQAFAIMHGKDKVKAYSAGSKPSGKVNPKAIAAMKEKGYDLAAHDSKSIDDIPKEEFECVVSMGCGDECPWMPAKNRVEWDIPDPRNMDENEFNEVRDLIEKKVINLLNDIS